MDTGKSLSQDPKVKTQLNFRGSRDDDDMEVNLSSSGASGTRHKAARLRVVSSDEEEDAPLPKKSCSVVKPNSIEIIPVRRKAVIVREKFKYLELDEDFDKWIKEGTKTSIEESIQWEFKIIQSGGCYYSVLILMILENVKAILDNYCQPDDSIPDKMHFFTPEDLEKLGNIYSCLDEEPQDEDVLMDVNTIHNTPGTAFLLMQSDVPTLNNELNDLTEDDDNALLKLPPLNSPPSLPPPTLNNELDDLTEDDDDAVLEPPPFNSPPPPPPRDDPLPVNLPE
ncbi:hypothetical protein EV368DRAFT_70472, partial [Lentinula lateritia]